MRNILFTFLFIAPFSCINAQINTYKDSIETYQVEYAMNHEVVKGNDRKYIRFYPANETYRVFAGFEPVDDSIGIIMKTSGTNTKKFYRFGIARFRLKNRQYQLTIYKPDPLLVKAENLNYLFLPFTDETSGNETYISGRYIDLMLSDIQNHQICIDFNKAYNPYCAYTIGYNCPIPPEENHLPTAINAGEKNYAKGH